MFISFQLYQCEHFMYTFFAVIARYFVGTQTKFNILGNIHMREKLVVLKNHSNITFVRRHMCDVNIVDNNYSIIRSN